MIPSLVANELREAIVEYLSTTFALSDDDARHELARFLADPVDGIFRGPYLRVRTPFRKVADGWAAPLDWLPEGFLPYLHQAAAWRRLSSRDREPQPTLVTTGTGSGKTEAFLYPILDHCLRANAADRKGVKALLLYPMNALATDQAGRLARLLHDDRGLSGVTAGIYIGGEGGGHTAPDRDNLVDDRNALRESPPDILLTNYKMLDFLLLREADHQLWVSNHSDTFRYVVLDEFHTYDGAQGTDVAMLLRRLGATLGVSEPGRPLGSVCPVATSATLGSGPTSTEALREFAQRVFGMPFDDDAIIGESRQTADEACGTIDYELPIPEVADVLEVPSDDLDALAVVFTGRSEPLDEVSLGEILLHHPLTWAVLDAGMERARAWPEAVDRVVTRAPNWGAVAQRNPAAVSEALARYLAVLSVARRDGKGEPLFAVEVQIWVREVSRLLRSISAAPSFRWLDSGTAEDEEPDRHLEAPAVYCRHCGRAGWMAIASEFDGSLRFTPRRIYQAASKRSGEVRALIRAAEAEADVVRIDTTTGEYATEAKEHSIAVLRTATEADAKRQRCPSCRRDDAIRFLGSQVASLASVGISQLFGSGLVNPEERKLLAFTDSVQDASHRAAFFAGRTYRFNLRTVMADRIADAERLSLADLADEILAGAEGDLGAVHALVPPDLLSHPLITSLWSDNPRKGGRDLLRRRLAFESAVELGLRSRVGRTLELTGTAVASVAIDELSVFADLVAEAHLDLAGQQVLEGSVPGYEAYLRGLLDRLRLQGGIAHAWLEAYITEDGNQWRIWGGRPDGLPPFPSGQSRPVFFTTGAGDAFDSVTATPKTPTWLLDWATRTLGVSGSAAAALNQRVLALLAAEDMLTTRATRKTNIVYALEPARIDVTDLPDVDDDESISTLRCEVCAGRHVVPPNSALHWIGTPCLRYRCPGTYEAAPADDTNYYRQMYRSGSMRRVVTAEHTGLLNRDEREKVEGEFKSGTRPDAPNVIACTPTMELGIDIGDLSAVLLTSVPRRPASYIQRVGRAGRLTGNAFIATFVPTEPRSLYYLEQPEHMLAGEVRPPNCYLDAVEILRRQYFAYLIDRTADGAIDAPPMAHHIGPLLSTGLDEGGWLRTVIDTSRLDTGQVEAFLALFGDQLGDTTTEQLREFAAAGLEVVVKQAVAGWQERYGELTRRRNRLKDAIDKMEGRAHLDEHEKRELQRLKGERHAVIALMREQRDEYSLSALEAMGLLPNYTLHDDATRLHASLWWRDDEDSYQTASYEYARRSDLAISEFAPGNTFYVKGHRLLIDGLEIGTAEEPLYEHWRLCPDCGFGAPETSSDGWASCPRCNSEAIADTSARHQLLRHQQAYSSDSEEASRVYDERDERERRYYTVVTTVDVDPADIPIAWQHTGATFGMELAKVATIRILNFGPTERPGERVVIGGTVLSAPRFQTCRHCGVVHGVKKREDIEHRGWCLVRSGARKEAWDQPVLYHEVQTEAVRLLLPVSTFEVEERLASFKGALLLGLRLDFGGEPDHLDVLASDFPGSGGPGRRRFLVLHDTVPGGTGYLGRIADPERLREILEKARAAISRCPCRDEGRVACHRCLLGGVSPSELDLVSRNIALELLDQLLGSWDFERVATVSGADIGAVEESELERRFKVALRSWAGRTEDVVLNAKPGPGGQEALELRLSDGEETRRWLITEQQDLKTVPPTRPDYLITRQDGPAQEIAIYLDGFNYHASNDHNRLADDAHKREGVRFADRLVWSLTWDDVEQFHKAVEADVPKQPPDRPLLPTAGRQVAEQVHHHLGDGLLDMGVVDRNPVRQLIDYLRRPDDAAWERLALSTVAGLAHVAGLARVADTGDYSGEQLHDVLLQAVAGEKVSAGSGGPYLGAQWFTPAGLALFALLDHREQIGGQGAERWTVLAVIDDGSSALEEEDHLSRWRDWHQWGNVLQFLRSGDRETVITTVSRAALFDPGELTVVPAAKPTPRAEAAREEPLAAPATVPGPEVPATVQGELELVLDDAARELAEEAIEAGAPHGLVAGYELDPSGEGWMVEVAWPDQRVAILADENEERGSWLAERNWQARRPEDWTTENLLDALGRES